MTTGGGVGGSGEVDTLYIQVMTRLDEVNQQLDQLGNEAEKKGDGIGRRIGGAIGTGLKVVAGAALAVGAGVAAFIADGFQGVQEGQDAVAQLEAVIKSTGNAAGVSSQHLQDFAGSIQETTKFTAEAVNGAQSMLLTFTNIGAKGGIFDQATKTALDMAQALGGDASQQAMQLGKALNDPVKGITALTRVGVTFSDEQKKTIEALVKTGDVAGAQSVILKELNKEFGGSAEAAGKTFTGQLTRAQNALGEIGESMAGKLMPYLQQFLDFVLKHMPQINDVMGKVADGIGRAIDFVAKNIAPAIGAAVKQLTPVFDYLSKNLVPFLLNAFREFQPTFQRIAAVFGDFGRQAQTGVGVIGPVVEKVWAVLRPIFAALGPLVAAAFELIQAAWNNVLRPVLTAVAPYFEAVFKVVGVVVQTLVRVVTGVIHAIAALFKGDFREAGKAFEAIWEQLKGAVIKIIATMGQGIMGTLNNILPGLQRIGANILDGLVNGLKAGLSRVVDAAKNIGSSVINTLKGVLGIASPSRVMKELGAFTSEGFVQGIGSKEKDVKAAAVKIGRDFTGALKDLKLERELGNIDLSTYTSTLSQVAASLKTQLGTVKEGTPAYSAYAARLVQVQKELTSVTGKTDTATQSQLAKNRADLEASIAQDKWVAGLKNATTSQLLHAQATARAAGEREKYDAITSELTRREDVHTAALDKARQAVKDQADTLAKNRATLEAGLKYDAWVKGLEGFTDAQLASAAAAARAAGDQQRYSAVMDVVARRADDARTALQAYNEALRQGTVNSDVSLGQVLSDPNGNADGARGYTPPQRVQRLSLQDVLDRVPLPETEAQVKSFTAALTDLNTTGQLQTGVFEDLMLLLPKFGDGVIHLGDAYADQEHFLEDNLSAFDQLRDAYASGRLSSQELHDKAVELSGTFAGLAANFERIGDTDLADLFRRAAREAQGLAASVAQADAGYSHLTQTVAASEALPVRRAPQAPSVAEGAPGRASQNRPPSTFEDDAPRRVTSFHRNDADFLALGASTQEAGRGVEELTAGLEAITQIDLSQKLAEYTEGLTHLTAGELDAALAAAKAKGDSTAYGLILAQQNRNLQDATQKTASWNSMLAQNAFQKWSAGLVKMSDAQLEQAKAAAEASQDTERYSAVLAELARRQEFANKPIVVGIQAVSQLAGAFAELAGAIGGPGGNDLQANLSGFTNLLGKGLAIAQDFASGNIVGGITKVISLIAEAIGGYQRAYAEADRLRKQFADSISPLLNPEDFSKTFVRSRGLLADFFAGGPEVVQEIDKVGLQFAESIAGGIESGFKNGLKKAILSGNINDFHDTFKQEVGSGILDGMIDAFLKQAVLQELLAGPIKAYVEALKTADPNDDVDALNNLLSKTDEAMALGDKFFAGIQPVREKLAGAGYISGPAPAGSIADLQSQRSQLQAQFDQATTDKDRRDLKAKIDELDRKISALQGQDTSSSASTSTSSGSGPITISGGTAATDTTSSGTISTAPLTVDFSPITLGGADIRAGGADIRAGASEFRQAVSTFMSGRGSDWTPLNTQG